MFKESRLVSTVLFTVLVSLSSLVSAQSYASWAPIVADEGFIQTTTGQRLHYISKEEMPSSSAEKKPLLLFIHGAPERAEVWEDYMEAFSDDYFTVAYTSRGYFPSSIPSEVSAYDISTLAADAHAVAQHFGYETYTLVGHDWGAATAWRVAMNYPNAVERMVILGNPHPVIYARAYHESAHHKSLIDAYIPLARENVAPWNTSATLANNMQHFKQYIYKESTTQTMPWSLGLLFEDTWTHNNGASIDAIYKHYKALDWPLTTLNTCNPTPTISLTVNRPVLLFYGEKDRFVSPEAYHLANNDCAPNTQYVPFANGNHFLHHEYKRSITWYMRRFLRQAN